MTFAHRKIDVTITLGEGDFGDNAKSDTVTLSGLRVQAAIIKSPMPGTDSAQIRIYGLTRDMLNRLSRLGKPIFAVRNNTITLSAGTGGDDMSQVFIGTIYDCYADFDGMPDSVLNVTAMWGLIDLGKPVSVSSFNGTNAVATVMEQVAAKVGKSVVNDGVDLQITDAHLEGTALDQMRELSDAAGINAVMEGDVITIWPKTSPRSGGGPVISKSTGLIGYPKFADFGMQISVVFTPGFRYGAIFTLQTEIDNANGKWAIYKLVYNLESETPSGRWEVAIGGIRLNEDGTSILS